MPLILFSAQPYDKSLLSMALEAGVDGVIVPAGREAEAAGLARTRVIREDDLVRFNLRDKEDEARAMRSMSSGAFVVLRHGWEVIPVENLLAKAEAAPRSNARAQAMTGLSAQLGAEQMRSGLAVEVISLQEAMLASGVLQKGVDAVVVPPQGLIELKNIVSALKYRTTRLQLKKAAITKVTPVGLGHRVCVDTLSMLGRGQGMLIGNSSSFAFLVHAETEENEYVAARPFRINAGGVHAYAMLPQDRTSYLEELKPGDDILIVDHHGDCELAVTGRIKIERRPMLLINAKEESSGEEGAIFLQNAETIRLVTPSGKPVSVVDLKPGDVVLCHTDEAGRHFGMRIHQDIHEV